VHQIAGGGACAVGIGGALVLGALMRRHERTRSDRRRTSWLATTPFLGR
jgi:hypothetical protein